MFIIITTNIRNSLSKSRCSSTEVQSPALRQELLAEKLKNEVSSAQEFSARKAKVYLK